MSPWSMPYDVCCAWTRALTTAAAIFISLGVTCRAIPKACLSCPRCAMFALFPWALLCVLYIGVLWSHRPAVDACQQARRRLAETSA